MTEIEIYETGQKVFIPSSWSEMSAEQVRFVFRAFDKVVSDGGSPLDFNLYVMAHFLGLKGKGLSGKTLRRSADRALACENLYRMCETCLSFMFREGENLQLTFDAVNNPLPAIGVRRFGHRSLIGPAFLLSDLTFGEFRRAAAAQESFFAGNCIRDLDECVAYLYRPRCSDANRAGRKVKPINARAFEKEVRKVHNVPAWQKNLIMCWFSACLKYLQTGAVQVDGETIEMSQLFAGDGPSSGIKFGWNDLRTQLAKDGTIGNLERVDEEPLFSIFTLMWHNHKERKLYEKNVKAQKSH